jgi:LuxR family maltose regulon positive regulatory protein
MKTDATDGASRVTRAGRSVVSAGHPILASKITPPDVPEWAVHRRRITKLIVQGTRWCPLTVVTGPPGAGKTMALALWTAIEPGKVAWICLDQYDNRPEMFWSYVLAALRASGVAVPGVAAKPGRAGDYAYLLRLAAALAAQDPPVTLVLDDLHLVTAPKILDGLDFILRNVGPGLRLVVASRMDPPLPLHRYRLAGQLAEIRPSDLAFSSAEAGLLLARHGCALTAGSLEALTLRTEGWAAGLRLAAISLGADPDPDTFVQELAGQDSALTGYLVDEVLAAQPPLARQVLLCTSVLDRVSADAAAVLTGDERAAATFTALAEGNAFIEPIGSGWYRYHTLFAEVLRLRLRLEHPDWVAGLHQRAARWYARDGLLTDAVRHAAQAGDWPLAAGLVIDELAIGQIIDPGSGQCLATEFAGLPPGQAWTRPEPYLISAAVAMSAGRYEECAAALDAADGLLERLPGGQEPECRLVDAIIRLIVSLRAGALDVAASAAARAEVLASQVPGGKLARHPDIRARARSGRGVVELWSGHLDEAVRSLEAGVPVPAASGGPGEPADCLGHLALAQAWRGQLSRAAELAGQAVPGSSQDRPVAPDPAALVALAWVHLERCELRAARSRLKQADAALGARPDKPVAAAAYLVAAGCALAEGRADAAAQITARARTEWHVPAWLDHQLSLVQSRAFLSTGDIPAALAAAERGGGTSAETAVTLALAWAAAGDGDTARRVLQPVLAGDSEPSHRVRVQAWLADARLSYTSGDRARGQRSLASALRLAGPEQVRLPFVGERSWMGPVLRRDPDLAGACRGLLGPGLRYDQPPAPATRDQAAILVVEPLSDREREVLRHLSGLLSTAEIANEMYISVNTVKTHLRNIYRKLATARRGEAVRRARQLELI